MTSSSTPAGAALQVVDVQNDFCPGGALAIPEGDEIVAPLNEYMERAGQRDIPVFLSRDWHPERTSHFQAGGGIWPPHCVRDTRGAAFHPRLEVPSDAVILSRARRARTTATRRSRGATRRAGRWPRRCGARGSGACTSVGWRRTNCVKASVLDALKHGFEAVLLEDAARGLDREPGDVARAVEEMRRAGARVARTGDVLSEWSDGR